MEAENIERPEGFSQVCVWPACLVKNEDTGQTEETFEKFMMVQFGIRVKYLEEIITLPDKGDLESGGRNDLFFAVHQEDVGKFAVPRLMVGIRWIEDVLEPCNYHNNIYPDRVFGYKSW